MSHYIAELITLAEKTTDLVERIRAQERCCATIERLWQHRSYLPPGARPLSNIEGILKVIEKFRSEKNPWSKLSEKEIERIGGSWMRFIDILEDSGVRACRIAFLTAIAEASFGKEKRWVDEHGAMLSEKEVELIKILDSWLSLEQKWNMRQDQTSIGSLHPEERRQRVLAEIAGCITKMKEASEKLYSDLSK